MSVNLSKFSLVQWVNERENHRCGYCHTSSGNISYGMLAEELTVEDYKDLIDRGWRRSGKYCYKPTMDKTCCPQYTIRCDTTQFRLNKSHKKIIKKFNKFVDDGIFNKNVPPSQQDDEAMSEIPVFSKHSTINFSKSISTADSSNCNLEIKSSEDMPVPKDLQESTCSNSLTTDVKDTVMTTSNTSKSIKKPLKDGTGPDPNKPTCKKAKLLRMAKKKEKMLQKGLEFEAINKSNNVPKKLSQFLEEIPSTAKHKLKLKLIRTHKRSEEWEQAKHIEFELYSKYQTIVHNDTPEHVTMSGFTRFLASSPLKIRLERMDRNHDTFDVSAEVYRKYQMAVHNDSSSECSPSEFYEFLINTPLKPKPFPNNTEGPGYGSFHQQYWIDDKLIAVGVVDILPGCVSSVYFFYDPDYRDLTLGTYGSLREIQLVLDLHAKVPDLKYYYMGFYIHSCPKMRYKGKLNPSDLLCPETYIWIPIGQCLGKLDVSKYSRLNEDIEALDTNNCRTSDINDIKVVYDYKLMRVRDFIEVFKANRTHFEIMGNLIGRKSARNIIFWMDSAE